MFISDRDLFALEPNLFRDAAWVSQTLVQGTGSISGSTLTLSAQDVDFEAAGVEAGHVARVDDAPYEVMERLSATSVRLSRLRARGPGFLARRFDVDDVRRASLAPEAFAVELARSVRRGAHRFAPATLVRARAVRELGGRLINLTTHAVLLGAHRDTQCGLKAFRSDVARSLFARTRVDGFAFDVELFHLAERDRLSLKEVPVQVANADRSSVRVVRDGLRIVRDLARIIRDGRAGRYDLAADEDPLVRR